MTDTNKYPEYGKVTAKNFTTGEYTQASPPACPWHKCLEIAEALGKIGVPYQIEIDDPNPEDQIYRDVIRLRDKMRDTGIEPYHLTTALGNYIASEARRRSAKTMQEQFDATDPEDFRADYSALVG